MNEAQITSISSASYLSRTLARNQKYCKILSITNKLTVIASQCGMLEFQQKYTTIETLVHMWEDSVPYMLVPVADSSKDVQVKVSCLVLISYSVSSVNSCSTCMSCTHILF